MSSAVAVFHGAFGRVCLYDMDRPMVPHGHREGHLVFHVQGPEGQMVVDDNAWTIGPGQAVAVSPWQAHFYQPIETPFADPRPGDVHPPGLVPGGVAPRMRFASVRAFWH
jgi:hypothetical protein